MDTALHIWQVARKQIWGWSWLKLSLWWISLLTFATSSFLYLTPPGSSIREFLADTVITTQHRDWAWFLVGKEKRDFMVSQIHESIEQASKEKQNLALIKHKKHALENLIKVEDISGPLWKGKLMYIYDPTTIRVVVPDKPGEGERISSMVQRTDALAGINGGGFIDPDGLGNGFAPIGIIMSNYSPLYTDVDADVAQHVIAFTGNGTLVVGKYSLQEMRDLEIKEAVSFLAPRLVANGKGQITNGDGGWGRAPRTAVGQKEDGTLIFVVIDGRQTHSVGATLKEVQDIMLERGAINAGSLDGGASSELVVNGELVTKPSSRWGERRLPSGFLVFDNPDEIIVKSVWEGITHIDPGGAYDHPDFLKDLAAQRERERQIQANKPSPSPTPNQNSTNNPKTDPTKTPIVSPSPNGNNPGQTTTGSNTGTNQPNGLSPAPSPSIPPKTGENSNNGTGTGNLPTPTPKPTSTPISEKPATSNSTPIPKPSNNPSQNGTGAN